MYAHHGRERLREGELAGRLAEADLIVTTYATATRDIEELAGYEWRRVVLDEAQAVKNSLSQAARAVRRLRSGQRIALTGTPVENRLAELWSLMDFLNPGLLGPADKFRTRYAIPVERHGQTEPAERLRTITRPYLLRRLKTDPAIITDLPEKIEIKQYCRLTTEQASLYQSVVDDMMEKIENSRGMERRGNVLAAMAKLKQVCNHPALLLHDRSAVGARSGKVIRLEEICEEILAEGDKALLFTQFTEFAAMLLPHLAARFGTDIAYLHGGTSRKRRDELVTRFQSGDGPPLFLLSLRAGGTGLNLTAANHVIHLDRWWNPAVEDQATDRAFRIGQKRNVQVRKFICTGTLEEKIDEMIEEKKALASLVISDGEGWLTELSTGELRSIFELSAEAVGDEESGGRRPRRWFPTEPTRPLAVSGGLKARSTRGAIGQTWWSGRFIAVLEAIIVGGRLERGRNYARRGQVISMDVTPGMVSALVQGSRVQPYRVRIGLDAFGVPEWDAAERALAASAWYSAKLLAGEMPEDIDEVFAELGLALFPASAAELSMYCSCRTGRSPASTSRQCSTCWPRRSTTIRSASWPGAGGAGRTCWPGCTRPAAASRPPRRAGRGAAGRLPRLVLRDACPAAGDSARRGERVDPGPASGAAPGRARAPAGGTAPPGLRLLRRARR